MAPAAKLLMPLKPQIHSVKKNKSLGINLTKNQISQILNIQYKNIAAK